MAGRGGGRRGGRRGRRCSGRGGGGAECKPTASLCELASVSASHREGVASAVATALQGALGPAGKRPREPDAAKAAGRAADPTADQPPRRLARWDTLGAVMQGLDEGESSEDVSGGEGVEETGSPGRG